MANHGVVTYGPDLLSAYMKMETVEHFARIALVTHQLGRQQLLSKEEVDKLLECREKYEGVTRMQPAAADYLELVRRFPLRQIRSAAAMNSGPLSASRQAAVATHHKRLTPALSHSARNRRSASSAFATASAASNPVDCTSRPRPARTFSLKIGVGERVSPS